MDSARTSPSAVMPVRRMSLSSASLSFLSRVGVRFGALVFPPSFAPARKRSFFGARMRRDVRAEESPERGRERAPAGVGLRVRPRLGVAAEAAGGLRNIEAALRVLCERVSCDGEQRQRAVQNQ